MLSSEILSKTRAAIKESNLILINELIYDLEKRGVPPVISIAGKICNLVICHNHLKNFYKIIAEFGLKKDEFFFMVEDCKKRPNYQENKYAMAVNKKTGKIKEYLLDNWENALIIDLKKGFWL